MVRRRAPLMVGLVLVLVAGLVADRAVARSSSPPPTPTGPTMPTMAPDGALSATWFCPGATGAANGVADGRIVIANPADGDLTGTVTVFPLQGQAQVLAVRVPARRRLTVRPGDVVSAAWDASLVQLDGSQGLVEQQISTSLGESSSPCASQASDRWYFAAGSTNPGSQMLLSLFNPFPADAVVDFDFATDTGRSTPSDLQGVVVPAQGLLIVDVGQHVRRRAVVSTTITARRGRIVADRIQLVGVGQPQGQPQGATLTLGSPVATVQSLFPDGNADAGVDERYELYNPTDHEADVQLALLLDRGSADPFQLVVAAHDRVTVHVNAESRIPHGVAHAGVVTSTNGVGIVAERVVTAGPPSARRGISDLLGATGASTRWVFPVGSTSKAQDEWLVAFNPGSTTTQVSVTALVAGQSVQVPDLQAIALPGGSRVAIRLGDHVSPGGMVIAVDARAPVVVERDLYRIGAAGISAALGIPAP